MFQPLYYWHFDSNYDGVGVHGQDQNDDDDDDDDTVMIIMKTSLNTRQKHNKRDYFIIT